MKPVFLGGANPKWRRLTARQVITRCSPLLSARECLEVSRALDKISAHGTIDPEALRGVGVPRPEWAIAELRRIGLLA